MHLHYISITNWKHVTYFIRSFVKRKTCIFVETRSYLVPDLFFSLLWFVELPGHLIGGRAPCWLAKSRKNVQGRIFDTLLFQIPIWRTMQSYFCQLIRAPLNINYYDFSSNFQRTVYWLSSVSLVWLAKAAISWAISLLLFNYSIIVKLYLRVDMLINYP